MDDNLSIGHQKVPNSKILIAQGEIKKAIAELMEADDILDKYDSWSDIFYVYTRFIDIYSNLKDMEMTQLYYEKLEKILPKENLPLFYSSYLRYYHAVVNEMSPITRNRAKPMGEYENLAKM